MIAGTATAVSNRVSRRQGERWQAQEAQGAAPPPQQAAVPTPVAAPAGEQSTIEQLKELAALKDQGVLTEQEFAAQKAKILG
jgi:hypothetical protein